MRILTLAVSSTLVLTACASAAPLANPPPETPACTEYRTGFDRFPRSYTDQGELIRPTLDEARKLFAHLLSRPLPPPEERTAARAATEALLADGVSRAEREPRITAYARAVRKCASAREWEKWRLLAWFARDLELRPDEANALRAGMIRYVRYEDGIPATLLDVSLRVSIAKTAAEHAALVLPAGGKAELDRLEQDVRAEARKLKAATAENPEPLSDAAWEAIREELPAAEGFLVRLREIVPED